jgi:hypothetical protein
VQIRYTYHHTDSFTSFSMIQNISWISMKKISNNDIVVTCITTSYWLWLKPYSAHDTVSRKIVCAMSLWHW